MANVRRFPGNLALILLWLILLGGAFALDRPIASWVRDTVPVDKHHALTRHLLQIVKLPGWFPVTLCIAVVLGVLHPRRWQGAVALLLSAVTVGALYSVIKWAAGRHRPVKGVFPFAFHPFPRGFVGLWKESALCFPSGHASLSFATAACLALLMPRWWWVFYLIALCTAVERVLENAHYLSDVVAGAGLGLLVGTLLTRKILRMDDTNRPNQLPLDRGPAASADQPARTSFNAS